MSLVDPVHAAFFTTSEVPHVTRHPIILVHGTWGRGFFLKSREEGCEDRPFETADASEVTRWFKKGSQFRRTLDKGLESASLEYSVRPFLWSGANSVFARDRAAAKLAEELKTHLQDQGATPVVIAHSHGGNVALRALSHMGDASRVAVVTLATPFLRVFARNPPRFDPVVWILLWMPVAFMAAVPTLAVVAAILSTAKGVAGSDLSDRLTPWILAGALAVAALGGVFILRWLRGVVVDPQSQTQTGRSRAHDVQDAAAYPPVGESGPRMLVIRGVDDEASLTLAAGAIGSRLSSLVLRIVIPGFYVFTIFLLAVLDWSGIWKEGAELLLLAVLYGCAFGALACLFLPGLCKSAFGREFLSAAFVCETAADSAPDTSARIDSVTLSPIRAGRGLRHCIYEHPACVDEIVRWIGGLTQRADSDARPSVPT
jgi:hypothetical protein